MNTSLIIKDLSINSPYIKGQKNPVDNCWHFFTDGNRTGIIYDAPADYQFGMNLIFILKHKYKVSVLAFVLMNTHFHFILYGRFDECAKFIKEYIRLTSQYVAYQYDRHKILLGIKSGYTKIKDVEQLKTSIAYVLRNPVKAGMPFMVHTYPASSGALYFRAENHWFSSNLENKCRNINIISRRTIKRQLHTHFKFGPNVKLIGRLINPSQYVEVEIVEKLFRSQKAFSAFCGQSCEDEVEGSDWKNHCLSINDTELIKQRNEICLSKYNTLKITQLTAEQRGEVARTLWFTNHCTMKQLARVCYIKFDELSNFI